MKQYPQWTHLVDPSAKYRRPLDPRPFTLPKRAHRTLLLLNNVEGSTIPLTLPNARGAFLKTFRS